MTGATEQKKHYSKGGHKEKHNTNKDSQGSENDTEVMKAFREYSKELDTKHDKYERIVKLSRDITIASKRIIFSIHALFRSKNIDEDVHKISESFKELRERQFKSIGNELQNEDPYQFVKAYMWGIQEFVEAITFFRYTREGRFCGYEEVLEEIEKDGDSPKLLIPLIDYILGLEDMTGELMRQCIDSFAGGRVSEGRRTRDFGRRIYAGLLYLLPGGWSEYNKKVTVAKQSLEKMEYAAYTNHVRGSELSPDQSQIVLPYPD